MKLRQCGIGPQWSALNAGRIQIGEGACLDPLAWSSPMRCRCARHAGAKRRWFRYLRPQRPRSRAAGLQTWGVCAATSDNFGIRIRARRRSRSISSFGSFINNSLPESSKCFAPCRSSGEKSRSFSPAATISRSTARGIPVALARELGASSTASPTESEISKDRRANHQYALALGAVSSTPRSALFEEADSASKPPNRRIRTVSVLGRTRMEAVRRSR